MANETFTVTETIVLKPGGGDTDGDNVIDPGEIVRTTVTITNNSTTPTPVDAIGLQFSQTLNGMTLFDQVGLGDINVSPIAFGDSYTAIGNTLLEVGNATGQTGPQSSIAGHVTDNDLEFFGGTFTISAFTGTSTQGGTVTMITSGADMGSFTYISAVGFTGGVDTFTYTIRDAGLDGIAGNADDLSSTATVTITVTDQVWYVDSAAGPGGNGKSNNPFNSITALNTANVDGANDYIYVQGNASGTLTLEAGEHLIGTGSALTVGGFNLAAAGANSSITASSGTVLTLGTGNEVSGIDITGTSGANGISGSSFGALTLSDVAVSTATGQILNLATGTVAAGGVSFNSLTATGTVTNTAIAINNVDGGTFTSGNVTIANTSGGGDAINISGGSSTNFVFNGITDVNGSSGDGVELNGANGTVSFNNLQVDAVTGIGMSIVGATNSVTVTAGAIGAADDPGGDGVNISGGTGQITFGATVNKTTAGNVVDISGHNTGTINFNGGVSSSGTSNGVSLTQNTGGIINFNAGLTLNTGTNTAFNFTNTLGTGATVQLAGGNLDIDTTSGAGINATSTTAGAGTLVITGANNSITTTTGTALTLTNVQVGSGGANGIALASLSTNGAANGVLLTGVSQGAGSTGIDILGGSIVNASVRGVDIDATSADVSIAATISTTAAGRSVEVTGSGGSGGRTIVFSGAIDENGIGINLDNNDQLGGVATVNFTGGLDIDSTTFTGFNAINGGTVNVTGTNTINNTTGIGVNVANTTIGASGLTFQTIATSGAASGIVLNNTGAGAFTVTGTGAAFSGGTITGSTGSGISLTNSGAVSLNYVRVMNSAIDGVFADTVAGLRFDNSSALNNGNAVTERGLDLHNVTGTVTLLTSIVTGNSEDNFRLHNETGTVNLTITGSTFADVSTAFGNDGVHILADGNSTVIASITNSTFTNHRGDHFQVTTEADANSTTHFTFSGNTLTGDRGVNYGGNDLGGGITINPGTIGANSSNMTFNIANNNIQGAVSSAIMINRTGDNGTTQGTIQGNTIGTPGTTDSGSSQADGITVFNADNGTVTVLIHDNDIYQWSNASGIQLRTNDGNGRLNATVTNNLLSNPGPFGANGLLAHAGAVAGDAGTLYLDIANNTMGGSGANGSTDFRVRQRIDTDVFLEGYVGGQYDDAAVVLYLQNRNTGAETGSATHQNGSPDPDGFFNVAAVPLPNSPTLPPAPLFAAPTPPPEPDGSGKGDGTGGGFVPPTPEPDDGGDAADPAGDPAPTPTPTPAPADGNAIIVDDGYLSQAELDFFVDAAIDRWAATGLTAEQLAALEGLTFRIAEMSGLNLGSYELGVITLDNDGAGRGWYADATPLEDSEFGITVSATRLAAIAGTAPAGRFDLLTTVMHEMGHALGLSDLYDEASRDELLYGYLFAGERRLPGADDADGAIVGSVTSEAFAGSLIQVIPADANGGVFTLPAGQSVTIQWDATIDLQQNQLIVNPVNQGTVSATNPPTAFPDTNTNSVTTTLDTLVLGGTVWHDNGAGVGGIANNGIKDGTEAGIDGVTVALFVDSDYDNVADTPGTPLLTDTTSGGGNYDFTGLAPGEYIVRVDSGNFGTVLANRATSPGNPDPDDNIDNDDNGFLLSGAVFSNAITLAYNSEPDGSPGGAGDEDGDPDDDTNFTLDFGFVTLNQAPVNTVPGTQTIDEDTSRTFNIANGNLISISDADAGAGEMKVTLSVLQGTLTLSGIVGLTFDAGDGTADATMTFRGTTAAVNTALNGLVYAPTGHYNGADTLTVTTNDQGNTGVDPGTSGDGTSEQDSDPITINITAINDTPVVSVAAGVAADEQVATTIDATATISDIDLGALNGGSGNFAGAVLTLSNNGGGGTQAEDLFGFAASGSFTVVGSNLMSGGNAIASFTGGTGSANLVITFANNGTIPTTALVNAVLQSLQYTYDGNTPPATVDLRLALNDGAPANAGQGAVGSNPATGFDLITVTLTDTVENATPTLDLDADDSSNPATGTGFAAADYTEGDTLGVLIADGDSFVDDADLGDNIESATISVQAAVAGDSLVLGPQVGYVINGSGTTTITITGTGTGDDYEAIIEQIRFLNTGDNPTAFGAAPTRTISSTVNDGTASSVAALTTIDINGSDDPAVANDDAFTTNEATTITGASANVFLNNGSGADTDPDDPLTVTAVTGGTVGTQFALPSGALLTLNSTGTFNYNPNNVFNATPTPGSGATNQPAEDSFSYTIAGGDTAQVTITINGVDTDDELVGTSTGQALSGGTGNDTYFLVHAGDFAVEAVGEGNRDIVYATMTHALVAGSEVEILSALDNSGTTAFDLHGNELANELWGNEGANYLSGGGGNDGLVGFGGNDLLMGNADVDWLDGGEDDDALYGEGGDDTLHGRAGDDYLVGGAGADAMYGGAGDDVYLIEQAGDFAIEAVGEGIRDIVYTTMTHGLLVGSEVEILTALDNTGATALDLHGNALANELWGNDGVNYLNGGAGTDGLVGFGGNDLLLGGGGADWLDGGDDNDALYGGGEDDTLHGGAGNDFLDGGAGADNMNGGTGDDTYLVEQAGDFALEAVGEGSDIVYTTINFGLVAGTEIEILTALDNTGTGALDLHGNAFANELWGNDGVNYMTGGAGDDGLVGFGGNDLLMGNAGADWLDGGAGADALYGEGEDDTLIGREGNDYLVGGAGADVFLLTGALGATNVDAIADFQVGIDLIALDDAFFTGLSLGGLPPGAFATGTAAGDPDDRIVYDAATGALYFDADGSGAGAQVQFASVQPGTVLTASDFMVI